MYSWREPKTHSGAATVVLSVSEEPFTFTGHLAPEHARALAANLLAAADQAERAQALLDARAARAAARAACGRCVHGRQEQEPPAALPDEVQLQCRLGGFVTQPTAVCSFFEPRDSGKGGR